jgi:hypothetical protein
MVQDPVQEDELTDHQNEAEMKEHLITALLSLNAPSHQYERLGLDIADR